MARLATLLSLTCLVLSTISPTQAQTASSYLVLKNGDRVSGPVVLSYQQGQSWVQDISVGQDSYDPQEVLGFRRNSDYYRLLRTTTTVERQVGHPRESSKTMTVERERVRYKPILRYVDGPLDLYSGAPSGLASKPYKYVSKADGKLYEVSHDNLRHLMSDHPESLSRLNRSRMWRRARNGALVAGSGLAAWGIIRGVKYHPGDPTRDSPYSFEITSTLIVGFASLAGAYLLDRKVELTFWESIQHYNTHSGARNE